MSVPVTLRAVRKVYSSAAGEVHALGPIDLDVAQRRASSRCSARRAAARARCC